MAEDETVEDRVRKAAEARGRSQEMRVATEALTRRGSQLREEAGQAAARVQEMRTQPGAARPEGLQEGTCPACGARVPAGVGCSLCPGVTLKGEAATYGAAETAWAESQSVRGEAEGAHHEAQRTLDDAERAWEVAETTHTEAVEAGATAEVAWSAAREVSEQAEVDWEEAQTRWKRAREAHEDTRGEAAADDPASPGA
jgi:hypothetical protein